MKPKIPTRLKMARPNKIAIGMTVTAERSNHRYGIGEKSHIGMLSVRGTCDPLSSGLTWKRTSKTGTPCPCCGQEIRKFRLNDSGRIRLRALKRRRKD